MSSPASSITVANISAWNAKQDALTFDSLPTENSDNLVKSGALYTVLTNTELVVATALNDLNQRVSSNQSSISNLYGEIDRALTAVLTYKGTVGSNGDYTSLPSSHEVGDVYVVSSASTFAGQSCEVGDYIICKTSRSTASDNDWNVVNGENQVSNSAATLAAAGSNVTIATVDGTNITISTPASWTGVSKNGTLTGVTVNGVSASVSNGVASISLTYDSIPTENSDNLVKSGDLYTVIVDNEEVTAAALNDLNDRMINVENGMVNFSEQDPIFSNSAAASISSANISSWNAKQDALTFDSVPTENSDNLVKSGDLYTVITQNEFVAAAALNDLNDRVEVLEENQYNFDSLPTENSENLVNSGALYSVIVSNERVVATALNDVNDRLMVLENNMSDAFEDVNSDMSSLANTLQTSEEVTAAALNDLHSRVNALETGSGGGGGITGVTFNGVAASISNGVATISASIPAAVTEATVSGWGFTKNTGTLTTHASHKLTTTNSTATSVNQGTEITFIESLTGTTTATSGDLTVTATRKKVTIPTAVTEATVSGWGFTKNAGTLTGISMNSAAVSISNGVANLGTVLTSHQSIKTINSQTMTGSGNVTIREIPACTSSDNGKVLQVVNGSWTLVTPVSIYSGSSNPDSSQGTNGDLYLQTS
jgi:hypothetical protein